jgi:hypothetical protein
VPRIKVIERLARRERWAGHGVEGGRGVAAAKGASGEVAPLVDRTRPAREASREFRVAQVPGGCVASFAGRTVHTANRAAAKAAVSGKGIRLAEFADGRVAVDEIPACLLE